MGFEVCECGGLLWIFFSQLCCVVFCVCACVFFFFFFKAALVNVGMCKW